MISPKYQLWYKRVLIPFWVIQVILLLWIIISTSLVIHYASEPLGGYVSTPYQTTLNKKKAITKSDQPTQRLRPRAKLQLHPSPLRPHRDHPLQRRQTEAALLLDIASHQDNALAGPVHHRHGRSGNCCCLIPGRARESNRYRDTCRYLVRTPVLPSTIPLSLALC
jgi:hypothetical protein